MNTRLRILCLEDEPDDVELVRHALVSGGIEADLEVVADGESFLGALESVQCDLILSDYALPHYDGLKALEAAQRRRPDIPFIFVSGRLGEEAAIEALKHGATDYVLKNSLMRLPSVVRRALEEVRQRRARELAEKAHARMALILDQTVDFVVMADPQQRVFYLNQAGRRMLGFAERDDPSDHRLVEFYPAWAVELFLKEALPAAIRQGVWTGESALLGRNGGEIPVLQVLLTHKDTAGNLEFLSTIARDITDRKRAEGELRESERKFKSVFSSSLDAILIFDAHSGEILAANPACKRIFGYEGEELVGKSFSILVPRESNISPESMFEKIRSYGAVFEDQDFLRANGSPCPMDITAGLIPWKTGHAILACFRDVSERKSAEATMQMQLQRIKALRSIDMAISGSMDIRVTIMIILDAVITRLKIDAADILTYDRQTHMLDYCDGRGFRTNALRHTRLRVGSGYAGLAALNRKTVKVADLRRSSGEFVRSHHLLRENFVSYFAVPLVAKGELKGVIELFHRSEIEPDDDWFDFLETLANQAALAIEDARLYQNLQQSNSDLTRAVENTLEGWVRSLDLRDQEPEGHTQRVTRMALRLARLMNFDDLELVHVRRGAMLHDIGKLGVPDHVLLKPGPLDESEWDLIRRSPALAYDWLSPIEILRPALEIPHCHHERWDGSGYPRALKGDVIPLSARIFSVVEVWDMMLSERPYRKAYSEGEVREYIRSAVGKQFDPRVAECFLNVMI